MAWEDFLNNTCDIYHLVPSTRQAAYGIPIDDEELVPKGTPSESDIPCHFHIKQNNNVRLQQMEPYTAAEGEGKMSFPMGTDIRVNDVILLHDDGLKYRAGIPRRVRNHHIICTVYRMDGVKGAI